MKKIILLIGLCCFFVGYSQAPAGYYSTATGTGYTLKTQLYNKIKGHTDKGYAGLWTTYSTSDRDHQNENDNTIFDLYSENQNGVDPYTFIYSTEQCGTYAVEGDCYNREHMIPQSVFNSAAPMVSDAHFIPPTDGKVNGLRSDFPHGMVAVASTTTQNGSKLGTSAVSGFTGTVFEPANAFKGDIARMYFYFVTRYENTVANYIYPMFNRTSNQVFTTSFLNMLLTWHANDPVSAREIERNNAIYARQGNRNPFIDNPSYVNAIWGAAPGGGTTDTTAPSIPLNLSSNAKTTTSVSLTWSASTDNVGVIGYEVYRGTTLITTTTATTYNVTGLTASTAYTFSIKAKDAAGNKSASSTTLSISTNATTSTSTKTELYLSEYVEGTSNNKALEIKNETNGSVSLTSYSIKKQTNGAGSWSTGLILSGTLAINGKFVIVNSAIASSCFSTTSANLSTAVGEMTFNGNDAIGLFKNGVLIDCIGTFNGGTANFAADVTLRRKTTATAPKATYAAADWDVLTIDSCTGLGNKVNLGNVKEILKNNPEINVFPNPNNGNFTIQFDEIKENNSVEIYSILGQKVFEKLGIKSNTIEVSNLEKGVYFIKVNNQNNSKTKKVIVN
jgi:endonuclease I/chitodextrinase